MPRSVHVRQTGLAARGARQAADSAESAIEQGPDDLRRRIARWFSRRMTPQSAARGDLPEHLPARGIHRILICRATRTLGETLLLSPLLQEIEARFPGAEVDIVSGCGAAPALFARYPQVRRVTVLPRSVIKAPLRYRRILKELRAAKYDLAIDPYLFSNSDRLLVRTSQARFRIGVRQR